MLLRFNDAVLFFNLFPEPKTKKNEVNHYHQPGDSAKPAHHASAPATVITHHMIIL